MAGSTSAEVHGQRCRGPDRDPGDVVIAYHQRTKHHPQRYALSPGFMDWANQPNPFRRYRGARLLQLDHLPPIDRDRPLYDEI